MLVKFYPGESVGWDSVPPGLNSSRHPEYGRHGGRPYSAEPIDPELTAEGLVEDLARRIQWVASLLIWSARCPTLP